MRITVSDKNLVGLANFLLTQGAGCLERGVEIFLEVDWAFKERVHNLEGKRPHCIKEIGG